MTKSSRTRRTLSVVAVRTALALSAVAMPGVARGDGSDAAAAQALFDQARQLMASGKYADACPRLEESQRLDPGSGTLLNLADCYEKSGRKASAWSKFLEAAAAAQTVGKVDREKMARERAATLAVRLPKIVINVVSADKAPGLEVKRDDLVVGKVQWGVPIPADAGSHMIRALAPGRKAWEQMISVVDGATATVTVPELETSPVEASAAVRAAGVTSSAPNAASPATAGVEPADGASLGTQKALALAAVGIGVVGIGVGTAFGLKSKAKRDEADTHYCAGAACWDQQGVDLRSDAIAAGNLATVAFVAGAVGLAGGAVLWLTAKPASASSATASVAVTPGALLVRGTW